MPPVSARLPEDAVEPPLSRRGRQPLDAHSFRVTACRSDRMKENRFPSTTGCSDAAGRLLSRRLTLSPPQRARRGKSNKPTPRRTRSNNSPRRPRQPEPTSRRRQRSRTSQCKRGLKEQRKVRRTYSGDRIKRRGRKICIGDELQADSGVLLRSLHARGSLSVSATPVDPIEGVPPPFVHTGTGSAGRTSQHLLTHVTRS